jgi:GST-like protein
MASLQLYSFPTPNGLKVSLALEEMGLDYDYHLVDITKGDQFKPDFIAINPNSKIPSLVDQEGPDGKPFSVFESGAILIYLAEKTGKLLSKDPAIRSTTLQWLFFQMASVGPMFGQFGHFFKYAKGKCDHPYPVERYRNESKRILKVLEDRLKSNPYLAGEEYSIADIATFPWVRGLSDHYKADDVLALNEYPSMQAWVKKCSERPASRAVFEKL